MRQSLATAGALVGSAIAGLAFRLSGQDYIVTFALATIPAALALLITVSAFSPMADSQSAAKKKARGKGLGFGDAVASCAFFVCSPCGRCLAFLGHTEAGRCKDI